MTATLSPATALERLLGTVGEAMTAEVVALQADTPADVATQRLEHMQVSGAPVVDHGRVVGVVTCVTCSRRPGRRPRSDHRPVPRHEHHLTGYLVRELMTAEPVRARADAPLAEAVLAMDQAGVNRVPVVDASGGPVGILTRDDVLRVLARSIRQLGLPAGGRPQMEPD